MRNAVPGVSLPPMRYDMADLEPPERYKLMVNTITPRPIAWVITQDKQGRRNCAPFSFFNAMLSRPPLVAIGIAPDLMREGEKEKDTLRGIRETGEFTIALVDEDHAEAMNLTAVEAPVGVDEIDLAKIATRPASKVAPPLIDGAPVCLECRTYQLVEPSANSAIVLGEVLAMHVDDRFLSEENGKLRIDTPTMHLIGRQHGAGGYIRTRDRFEMRRKTWPIQEG